MRPSETTMRELARALDRHTRNDGEHATSIGALLLYRLSAPTELTPSMLEPALCLVAQGRKRAFVGKDVYHYDPSHHLVISADLPILAQITQASAREPYLSLKLRFDAALGAELLASLPPGAVPPPERAVAVRPIEPALLEPVMRLVALLDDAAHVPVLAPLVIREITYRLLVGPDGARFRQILSADGHARHIARALQWLREHYAKPLRVERLAQKVGMSASTFHHRFKTVTGFSPLQYQKRLRLQEARRLLLAEDIDAAEASYRVGYESPSQFSREYRRLFGAPPRRDVAVLQVAPPPVDF